MEAAAGDKLIGTPKITGTEYLPDTLGLTFYPYYAQVHGLCPLRRGVLTTKLWAVGFTGKFCVPKVAVADVCCQHGDISLNLKP